MMLTANDLDPDQDDAITRLYNSDHTFLVAQMGSGKTAIVEYAIADLIEDKVLTRVLVVAPLKVCSTAWAGEHKKWQELKGLRVGILAGLTPVERSNMLANADKYHIIVANFEILPWLKAHWGFDLFDGLVVDESTKLKSHGAYFKALRYDLKDFAWRVVMTGTPVSENLQQLFYQMFLVDNGKTFGKNRSKFEQQYFYPTDFKGYRLAVKPGMDEVLIRMAAPTIHEIPDYRDSLPPLVVHEVAAPLPPAAMKTYREMAGRMKTEGVIADTAAIKVMKLQQIANGFIYDGEDVIDLHYVKTDWVKDFKIGFDFGACMVLVYQFQEELDRLKDLYPELVVLGEAKDVNACVDRWNAGEIPLLALHPKSAGHGLDMPHGGNTLIWMSPPWSRDLFDQTNARLWRRHQKQQVNVYVLMAPDTVDLLIWERLSTKAAIGPAFSEHLAACAAAGQSIAV